jgi:putative spermidine/putrescine transport system permease protein
MSTAVLASTQPGLFRAVSDLGYRRPRLVLWMLLAPPLLWFLAFYLLPLVALLGQSLLTFDEFSMTVRNVFTLANLQALFTDRSLVDILQRTFMTALAVTLACALLGFPLAYYMARYATGRTKALMYVAVMVPMWASYIVKAYSWTVILAKQGIIVWVLGALGLADGLDAVLEIPGVGGNTLSTSHLGRVLVFTYMWLPFMILPVQASIERIPRNLLLASDDLGATPAQTFRNVILPLAVPGIAAGSIFTFCLTFGDYIVPTLVGPSGDFIGTAVYKYQGAIGNIPQAAALTLVPIAVVAAWLWLAKRLGAFDAL